MFSKSALVLACAALAAASPVPQTQDGSAPQPQLPMHGGGQELPGPDSGLQLKALTLGVGIQNYTCGFQGLTPLSTGAVAMLFDVLPLFPGQGPDSLSQQDFDALTSAAVNSGNIPLNFAENDATFHPRVSNAHLGVNFDQPFIDLPTYEVNGHQLPFKGRHQFNSQTVPFFELDQGALVINAAKDGNIPAPAGADAGPDSTGAVAWLELKAGPGSQGLGQVYRVVTAGGNPHGCTNAGDDSSVYSAFYWFYG